MNSLTVRLLLFAGSGLLLTGLSIPLIQRRVRPNYWHGFRMRRTLNDPAVWYGVNAYAGKRLLISGIITTIAAIVLYVIPNLTVNGYALGMTILGVGPLTIGLSQRFRYLSRLEG